MAKKTTVKKEVEEKEEPAKVVDEVSRPPLSHKGIIGNILKAEVAKLDKVTHRELKMAQDMLCAHLTLVEDAYKRINDVEADIQKKAEKAAKAQKK